MDIGKTVRNQRILKNLSVRDLAAITGLSPGAISKIENGKTIPNVLTMKNIATAMGVPVSYFFVDNQEELIQVVKKDERNRLVRNNSDTGEVYEEILVDGKDLHMQPGIITFTKGANSGDALSHKGEEFVYVLEGKIKCVLEGVECYVLESGDSIYYPSTIPHRWENASNSTEAKFIVIASPASF